MMISLIESKGEGEMNEPNSGLASLGLDNAIRLRWALRDIKGKRLKLTPVGPNDIRTLIDMGYVERQEAGHAQDAAASGEDSPESHSGSPALAS